MSSTLSVAAVTAALRNRLTVVSSPLPGETTTDLSDTQVTTLPPDKAGLQEDHNQINLFLYQIQPSPSGRNLDSRGQAGRKPALALELLYLVTFYGRNANEILTQRLLGRAMSLLHSAPALAPAELAAALPGSDLDKATDLVRLVPHLMPNEEMVRLWGTFQVKYRLSVAYRASIILIDHEYPDTILPAPTERRITLGPIPDGGSS